MSRWLVMLIYNLLLPVVLILGFPKFLIKGIRRGGVARNFRQRLGLYTAAQKAHFKSGRSLWIHAVSVGEVRVALKVAAELRRLSPGHNIIISTTTPTGFGLAEKEAPEGVAPIYNPVDLPWVVARAMRQIQPERLVLVEAEVWPNLVSQARRAQVPVILINARLSERSERRYRKFSALTQPIFKQLDQVGVQFEADADRMGALGIVAEKIAVTGSVKYDLSDELTPQSQIDELRGVLQRQGIGEERPIVLAGSTHFGEEAMIGKVCQRLSADHPELFYLVVPRHAERGAQVLADLKKIGRNAVLKSESDVGDGAISENGAGRIDTLVVNTTGELRAWYHLADVVVMGKSFLGRGGQNPVEPVVAGKAVITGPHMQNFSAIMDDLVSCEGVLRLDEAEDSSASALEAALTLLLGDADRAAKLAGSGRQALDRHLGATRRSAELILGATSGEAAKIFGQEV